MICENTHKYLLSIIIPVYNVEKYLERCVNSVLSQSNDNMEIILIDDGSTDLSGYICDGFSKTYKNIKVIHKENGGLSSARNDGIIHSNGEYVFFLDSDDSVCDGFIEAISSKIQDFEYDIVEFGVVMEKEYGVIQPLISNNEYEISPYESIERILRNERGNQVCFKVYRKRLFDFVRFPEKKRYEDISTTYKLILLAQKILVLETQYYAYNITNQTSITKNMSIDSIRDMFDAVNNMCSDLENETMIDYKLIRNYKNNMYIYMYIKLLQGGNLGTDLHKEIKQYLDSCIVDAKYVRYYSLKKLLFYKVMHILGRM